MKVIYFLLKANWRVAILASMGGGISGIAQVGLVAMISQTVKDPNASTVVTMLLFAALCAVVLLTRIISQILVSRLTQTSMLKLQMSLCRRILLAPVKDLEEIGSAHLMAILTGDVGVIAQAMSVVPGLGVDFVILICGGIYLGYLSFNLLVAALVICVLGVASYTYSAKWAEIYVQRAREQQNVLQQRIEELIDGIKELKMHNARRHEFVEGVLLQAETSTRQSQFVGECLQTAAIGWGRLSFFIAIGLLLYVWPRVYQVSAETLSVYVLTIFYLMSPLEQILGWLPAVSWATESVRQIERLGVTLDEKETEVGTLVPIPTWEQIELVGVTHAYRCQGRPHGFILGPLDLTLTRGETVFVIGGNGSGKTTLGKLLTGLYLPENGEVRLDGKAITSATREGYRQLFSVVFDDAVVFDSLFGMDPTNRDKRAQEYLRHLELDHVVSVTNGVFSTTDLSRGQRKRLALLTAYLEDRSIYVFDEWAADQDPIFRKIFYLRLLPELKLRGKTVIAITHDDRFFDSADRIVKLDEGKIVELLRHEAVQEVQLQTRPVTAAMAVVLSGSTR